MEGITIEMNDGRRYRVRSLAVAGNEIQIEGPDGRVYRAEVARVRRIDVAVFDHQKTGILVGGLALVAVIAFVAWSMALSASLNGL